MAPASLFLHSTVGHAHVAASRAVAAALDPRWSREEHDYLAFMPAWERAVWTRLYHACLRHAPALWRAWRRLTDRPGEPRFLRERVSDAGARGFSDVVRRVQPRVVVSTVSGAVSLAGAARRDTGARFVNALVVTHFRAHRHWARPDVDVAFVGTDEARADLVRHGIAGERVEVTGTPVRAGLAPLAADERARVRARLGLGDRPMIVVSSGGTGAYRAHDRLLASLAALGRPLDVLSFAALGPTTTRGAIRVHRLGFRDDFCELLAASDACVGKLGSLTAAEAAAVGTPIVVYEPIPGPEEGNADYLVRAGAALWPRDERGLRADVARVLDGAGAELADAASRVHRRDAAARIAARLVELGELAC